MFTEYLAGRWPRTMNAVVECQQSGRVDGRLHSWRFDGDDPYIVCVFCGAMQDALTGRVVKEGE